MHSSEQRVSSYQARVRSDPSSSPAPDSAEALSPLQERLNRSLIIESPALNYHLSETRLFSFLLARGDERLGIDLAPILLRDEVQKVLGRHLVMARMSLEPEAIDALRLVAHIYNSTLGADFSVHTARNGVYLLSDGAVRRVLEDLQEKERVQDPLRARSWSERKFEEFLRSLETELPRLEQFLLTATPEPRVMEFPNSIDRSQSLYVKDIVIPTANRPEDVARLLASLAQNFRFYGYAPQTIRITLVDTSTNSDARAGTRQAAEDAKSLGLNTVYLGPDEMRRSLIGIGSKLEGEARKAFKALFLRGLFSPNPESSVPLTIGTVRNAIALVLSINPYISLDDDMVLEAPIAKPEHFAELRRSARERIPSIDLHVGAAVDFMRSTSHSRQEFKKLTVGIPTDIVGIANRNLDGVEYVIENRIVGVPELSNFKDREGRVATVRPYVSNASPDVTIYLRRFVETGDPGELSGESAPASLPVEVPAACLYNGYSSGTMFATSGGLEAPFMDARAYEDVAQSHLAEFLYRGDMQFQGGVIEHRRALGSRVCSSVQYVDVLLAHHMMTRYLSSTFPDSLISNGLHRERDRASAVKNLGKTLYRDSFRDALPRSVLHDLTRAYLAMGRTLRKAGIEGGETFSTEPSEVEREIYARYRLALRTNGLLYHYWPEIARAAADSRVLDW